MLRILLIYIAGKYETFLNQTQKGYDLVPLQRKQKIYSWPIVGQARLNLLYLNGQK